MAKRIKKKPQRFGEWEETINLKHEPRKQEVIFKKD